jgi:hypothetical protein
MTFGKAAALTAGLAGAFALGVVAGPQITDNWHPSINQPSAAVETHEASPEPAAANTPAPKPSTRASRAPKAEPRISDRDAPATAAVPASNPDLHARLKKVLRSGAKMDVASEGFRSAEQFATVAHASRNTDVPFMLLKHRVVDEGKTVEAAIRESKPDVDAAAEAAHAREQARDDVGTISSAN